MRRFKTIETKVVVWLLCAASAWADEFDDAIKIVESGEGAVQSAGGSFIRTLVAWSPLILIVVGAISGIMIEKKKAENSQDNNKIYVAAAVGTVIALIIDVLIVMGIGQILLGDSSKGFSIVTTYWQKALLG